MFYMNLLICLPTFNEKENIAFMIDQLAKNGYTDFIVSDANSTDGTKNIAIQKGAKILPRTGHGKGFAVKDSLLYAQENNFEGLILLDCDRTYPVSAIKDLISNFQDVDLVVGCRNFKDIQFLRRIANYAMTGFTNLVFKSRVKDMATGMRILRVDKFCGKITARSFDVEPQIHGIALREKYKIAEVSIPYFERKGKSKINIGHLFLILYRILIERFGNN
jgi:glycosyltransferase involved in cell wall biosynthesis